MLIINYSPLPQLLKYGYLSRYLLRKLLYLPLGLLLLSLLTYAIGRITSGDAVQQQMADNGVRVNSDDLLEYERAYRFEARQMGLDVPSFYITVTNAALPDTLPRFVLAGRRNTVRNLALRYGNWELVQTYYRSLLAARNSDHPTLRLVARRLLERTDPAFDRRQLEQIMDMPTAADITTAHAAMVAGADRSRLLLPRVYWNGLENQYHRYLVGLLHGDLGKSYIRHRTVAELIGYAMPRTLLLNVLALLIVYVLAIPLGLYMAHRRGSRFDRLATAVTFLAFGIPSFWVATLLASYLTNDANGIAIFPPMGFGSPEPGAGFFERVWVHSKHLVLPVFCLVFPSLAYVSRHLRASAIVELGKPYVRTARMKGLTGLQVLRKHVFRNAAFPLVTLLGGLLPGLLAGSVLVEQIFNLPGMGQLLYDSATSRDWPVVTALVLINGLLTILGLVLADVGYALLDPRVQLGKRPPA